VEAGSYDSGKEIVALSILNGIVDRRGGWMYYNDRKWQGAQALIDSLREEVELREELTTAVMDTLKSNPALLLNSNEE
jgi:predicted RNase H-related nuclease YkuK (DUF458 family)